MVKSPNYINNVGRLTVDRFDFEKHINGEILNHNSSVIKLIPNLTISGNLVDNLNSAILQINKIIDNNLSIVTATVGNYNNNYGVIKISGDIDGYYDSITVKSLNGSPIADIDVGDLSVGNVLMWDGYMWNLSNSYPSGPAGGDLSGTYPNPSVVSLTISGSNRGAIFTLGNSGWKSLNPVSPETVLEFNGNGNDITLVSKNNRQPFGVADGDLSGTYPFPTLKDKVLLINHLQNINGKTIVATPVNTNIASAITFGNGIAFREGSLGIEKSHFMCIEEHFLINSSIYYMFSPISSGTGSFVTGSPAFSCVDIISTTANNSGGTLATDFFMRISGSESFACKFKLNSSSNKSILLGFFNSNIASTISLVFEISSSNTYAFTLKDGTTTTVSGNTTLGTTAFYMVEILVQPNCNGAVCRLFNSTNGNLIEQLYINKTFNIGGTALVSGVAAQRTSSGTSGTIITVDYIATTKYLNT